MTIEYRETLPKVNDFWELFLETGWNEKYKFNKTDLGSAIKSSWYVVSAYSDGKFVGFGRIISDGVYHALIVDIIVSEKFQGRGVGAEILKILIDKCRKHQIRDVQLFAAKEKFGFYEKYGFSRRPEDAPGMQNFNFLE